MFMTLFKLIKKYSKKYLSLFTKLYKNYYFLGKFLKIIKIILYIVGFANLFIATPIILLFNPIDNLVDMFDYLVNYLKDGYHSLIKNIYQQIYDKLGGAVNNPKLPNLNKVVQNDPMPTGSGVDQYQTQIRENSNQPANHFEGVDLFIALILVGVVVGVLYFTFLVGSLETLLNNGGCLIDTLYIQSIGSDMGILSGLVQVTKHPSSAKDAKRDQIFGSNTKRLNILISVRHYGSSPGSRKPLGVIKQLLHYLSKGVLYLLENISYFNIKLINYLQGLVNTKTVKLFSISYDPIDRCRIFKFNNAGLLNHHDLLQPIFYELLNNPEFTDFGKNKIIIATCLSHSQGFTVEYNLHPNILITPSTSFVEYFNKVKKYLKSSTIIDNYGTDIPTDIIIKVWNMDHLANKHIKQTISSSSSISARNLHQHRKYSTASSSIAVTPSSEQKVGKPKYKDLKVITPLLNKPLYQRLNSFNEPIIRGFACLDIETMDIGGVQIPICISDIRVTRVTGETITQKLFLVDKDLLVLDPNKAAKDLFTELYNYLLTKTSHTIYVHNLGAFDGYFIFKYFSQILKSNEVSSIIDESNKFIQIKLDVIRPRKIKKAWVKYPSWLQDKFILRRPALKGKYTFLDSYRIFPVSLNKLCEVFIGKDVQKVSAYKPEFNNPSLFYKPELLQQFKEYAMRDSIILHQAIYNATIQYINKYKTNVKL